MGVVNYEPIEHLTIDQFPPKLTPDDVADKFTAAPANLLAAGTKTNELIDSVLTVGTRVNASIDSQLELAATVNRLINAVNWLGNTFENIDLIGTRRYLAYQPDADAPDGAVEEV